MANTETKPALERASETVSSLNAYQVDLEERNARAQYVILGSEHPPTERLIFVAPTGIEALKRLDDDQRARFLALNKLPVAGVVLPPPPPPALPYRVLVLTGYSEAGYVVGVAERREDLAHLVHDEDRARFLSGSGEIWRRQGFDPARYVSLEDVTPTIHQETPDDEREDEERDGEFIGALTAPRTIVLARTPLPPVEAFELARKDSVVAIATAERVRVPFELTRKALLAGGRRRYEAPLGIKYVRLQPTDDGPDEIRFVDPLSGASHRDVVPKEERDLVLSGGRVFLDLDAQTVAMGDPGSETLGVDSFEDDAETVRAFLFGAAT